MSSAIDPDGSNHSLAKVLDTRLESMLTFLEAARADKFKVENRTYQQVLRILKATLSWKSQDKTSVELQDKINELDAFMTRTCRGCEGLMSSLPSTSQLHGMIASALKSGDGKAWCDVQKEMDRRDVMPVLAAANAAILLEYANGAHGIIQTNPRKMIDWMDFRAVAPPGVWLSCLSCNPRNETFYSNSREFLYTICRYAYKHPEHFDAVISAIFDSVWNMNPGLPDEIIDAVFKGLLSHEDISISQCSHVIAKLLQRDDQLEYVLEQLSEEFATLPSTVQNILCKHLLPELGRCPHVALEFILRHEVNSAVQRAKDAEVALDAQEQRLLTWRSQLEYFIDDDSARCLFDQEQEVQKARTQLAEARRCECAGELALSQFIVVSAQAAESQQRIASEFLDVSELARRSLEQAQEASQFSRAIDTEVKRIQQEHEAKLCQSPVRSQSILARSQNRSTQEHGVMARLREERERNL